MAIHPKLKLALKIIITVVILLLLLHEINLEQFAAIFVHAKYGDFVWALLLQLGSAAVAAYRWQLVMHRLEFPGKLWWYYRVYLIGALFNQVLPTSVGGDAVRVLESIKLGRGKKNAFFGVLSDRAFGITGIFLLNIIVSHWCFRIFPWQLAALIALISWGGLLAIVALVIFHKLPRLAQYKWFAVFVELSWRLLRVFKKSVWDVLYKLVLAMLPNFLSFSAAYCLARAVHMPISYMDILVVMPPIILLTLIPISLAGWGVREGAMVGLLLFLHIPKSLSLSVSVLFGLLLTVASLPGLYFYLVQKHHKQ